MRKCQHCGMEFTSKKSFVNHLSSKVHRKQSVYCPWCPSKTIFTRVVDLKAHCMSRHFIELNNQSKNFIGGNNCFYFAVYPCDYVEIFKPEPWENSMAIEARRLMFNMTERVGMSLQERDKIREGWREGKKTSEEIEEKERQMRKRRLSEKPIDAQHIYNEIFTASPLNIIENESSEVHIKRKQEQKEHSTTSNSDKQERIHNENVVKDHKQNDNKQHGTNKESDKHKKRETDKRSTKDTENKDTERKDKQKNRDKKRETDQHGTKDTEHTDTERKDKPENKHKKRETDKLGIRDADKEDKHKKQNTNRISETQKVDSEMADEGTDLEDEGFTERTVITLETGKDGVRRLITMKQKEKIESESKVVEDKQVKRGDDKIISNDVDLAKEDGGEVESMCMKMGVKVVNDENNNIMKISERGDAEDHAAELEGNKGDTEIEKVKNNDDDEIDNDDDENDEDDDGDDDEEGDDEVEMEVSEMDMASVWKKWDMERPKENAERQVGPSKSEERKVKLVQKNGQWRRIIQIPKRTETESAVKNLIEKEFNVSDVGSEKVETLESGEVVKEIDDHKVVNIETQTFAKRAIDILMKGAMPLCPPGRRDWSTVTVPVIIPIGETSFSWPPLGWQNLSADRKLLEWEVGSYRIETLINCYVPGNVSRQYLLDKYMFLALPGSLAPKIEESETSCNASRAFNYKMLKEIAKGVRQPTRAEEDHIITLEFLSNSEIGRPIDLTSLSVPLRLGEDTTK